MWMTDNERKYALLASVLIGLVVVLASPLLIWWSRRGGLERRRRTSVAWLCASLLGLWWLDAGVVMLALAVESGVWWSHHVASTAFFSLVLLGMASFDRAGLVRLGLSVAAIWGVALVLPWIPWEHDKRAALDTRRILGQPLETVQDVMRDYFVTVYTKDGEVPLPSQARVRDVELAALETIEIVFSPGLGGCVAEIADGRVASVWFNYD